MSKKYKCIIVDDEPPAIRLLENYIAKISILELTYTSTSALMALSFLEKEKVDIIFLDIQMPHLTGLQLSKIIPKNTKVIFTTAYPQFALESYSVNAIDYLLKPFDFERFYKAIHKICSKETPIQQKIKKDFIFIKTDRKNNLVKVTVSDIIYIESLKNYVAIHLNNKEFITYNSLKNIKESLQNENFVQIHKSYLVSILHIEKTTSSSVFIGNKEIPIGNSFKNDFFLKIAQNKL
ncbi:response regulator transcription factor [Polaribacter batillariae]|uniref:Response regulator transcription factor n=1 Tax=Polaribacter batillariae TaxID=2808900 RepID=A0ABX7SX56_9FLAO|nr:LytTR family DNA-binding domain-containing protein [Polaribacter batillariae]QTD37893.1 response regulator transcription factor [Polaribacter batillariae]